MPTAARRSARRTRYGILTGRYAWRTRLQSGVLGGDSRPLLTAERLTVATLLKDHGYATACIGKWHLGLKFGPRGYADRIEDGPLEHGFDYFFGISASLDMPPFAFIENHRFTEIPSVTKKWMRAGPAAKSFEAIDVLPTLTKKAVDYIGSRAADAKAGHPFFLYLAFASPHTPILPTAEWQGKSKLNAYGDFVMQTDWSTGQVLAALDKAGLADNTLVVFTSDNGCSPNADVKKLESLGHYPSAWFRGYKSDIWDGGHRIPLIVRWPGQVKPATTSNQLTCLTDLIATCADLLADKLPDGAGEDSASILPALLGRDKDAAARGGGASFDRRLFCNSPGLLEAGILPRLRRLECASRSSGDQCRVAASPALRHARRRWRTDERRKAARGPRPPPDEAFAALRSRRPQHARRDAKERRANRDLQNAERQGG